jgi:hypothetical protein
MDWFHLRWAFPIAAVMMLAGVAVFYCSVSAGGRPTAGEDLGTN